MSIYRSHAKLWKCAFFLGWVALIVAGVVPWGELDNDPSWTRVTWIPFTSFDLGDFVHNILLYVPFGFLYRTCSTRTSVWRLSGYALALSAATELTQLSSTTRYPSTTDVACNVFGAIWGAGWVTARPAEILAAPRRGPSAWYCDWVPLIAGLLITIATSMRAIGQAGPDALIVFRYITRWLDGHGLTFNDGEYVEGFTSLTWTLLLAGFARLTGIDVELAAILLNTLLLLAVVVMLDHTLAIIGASTAERAIVILIFATSYLYFRVAFLGLEFALFGLLLTVFYALLLLALRKAPDGIGRGLVFAAFGIAGGLLFATRPEAIVILPLTLFALRLLSVTSARHDLLPAIAGYTLATGLVVLWRYIHYGTWLPNTTAAKSLLLQDPDLRSTLVRRITEGATYLSDAYMTYPLLALIILAAIRLAAARALRPMTLLLLLPIVWGHVIVLENGGDWLVGFSLLCMYLPLYLVLGWSVAVDARQRYGTRAVVAFTIVALALHGWTNVRALASEELRRTRLQGGVHQPLTTLLPDADLSTVYADVGRALNKVWTQGDILVAESAGRIGYVAPNIAVYDASGLVDRTLAHDPSASDSVFGRMDWRYTLSLKPAVLLLHYWGHQQPWGSYDSNYPDRFDRYCVHTSTRVRGPFVLYVIIRKGRPQYEDAIRRIGGMPLQRGANGRLFCST